MIKIDQFTKLVLVAIALALVALLLRGPGGLGLQSEAQAQRPATRPQATLHHIRDIPVKDYKEVILLGDGKTFLLRVEAGIGVYQVQEF